MSNPLDALLSDLFGNNPAMQAIARRKKVDDAIAEKPKAKKTKIRKKSESHEVKTPDRPIGDRILLEFAGLPPIVISRDTAIERFKEFRIDLALCQEITVYLDGDPTDRTTVKPPSLNRNKTDFEAGTFGNRENAIAGNKRDAIALTPKIPYILNDKIVRSIFVDGVCVYGTIGRLSPVGKIERRSRSENGTKRRSHRANVKTIAPIPFDNIGDRRSFTDKKLGAVTAWIDPRSKRLQIETATARLYAYIGITPIRSVTWQCTDRRYSDITTYYNVRSGYCMAERSVDRNETPTQKTVNDIAPIPQCLLGFKISIECDRLVARSPRSATTIARLVNMDLGHSINIDRRLHSQDGTIADLNVDDKFWASLTKLVNGVYGTIANSDRRTASKYKSMIKSIAKTIAIVDDSHRLLTDTETKAIADRFAHMANRSGLNTINSIVVLCSQTRDRDNPDHDQALKQFLSILSMTKA